MKVRVSSLISSAVLAAYGSSIALAEGDGADLLVKAVVSTIESGASLAPVNVTDPFLRKLLSLSQSEKDLPYDVRTWVGMILKQDYLAASHLWTVVEAKVPDSFRAAARAAHVHNLWKLQLPQAFINEWTQALSDPAFRDSEIASVLLDAIRPKFDHWMVSHAVVLTSDQERIFEEMKSNDPVYLTLKAYLALRKGERGRTVVESIPPSHEFALPLAQTALLASVRAGDFKNATTLLKNYLEPAAKRRNDPAVFASHYLGLARVLYQAGSLDGAEVFYEKVPNGSPEFLEAREELVWVWLRKGDTQKLRGELKTLKSPLFEKQFAPEVYVVRGISNLKFCYYDEVEKDFRDFQRLYMPWARRIDHALKAQDPPEPLRADWFSTYAMVAVEKRQAEAQRLEDLAQQSITAVLPAVGPQSHWVKAKERVLETYEFAKKARSKEYRRQWKGYQLALNEAIRKMQFVKVELLSQVQAEHSDRIVTAQAAALEKRPDQIVFPFDGVVWADELFKLRAIAQGRCLEGIQ